MIKQVEKTATLNVKQFLAKTVYCAFSENTLIKWRLVKKNAEWMMDMPGDLK